MYKKFSAIMFFMLSMSCASTVSAATKKVVAKKQVAPKKPVASKKSVNPLAQFNSKKRILEDERASYAARIRAAFELQLMLGKVRGDAKALASVGGFSLRKSTAGVIAIPAVKKLDKKTALRIKKSLDTMHSELNAWTSSFSGKVDELNADRKAKAAQLEQVSHQLDASQNSLRVSLDQTQDVRVNLDNVSQANARLLAENSALLQARNELQERNEALVRAYEAERLASADLATQCALLRGQNVDLEARCGRINADNERLTAKLAEMCKQFVSLLVPCIDLITGTCSAEKVKQTVFEMLEANDKHLAKTRDLQESLTPTDAALAKQLDDAIAHWMAPVSKMITYGHRVLAVAAGVGLTAVATKLPVIQKMASGLAGVIRPASPSSAI